jgi:hypothetical protein
MRRPIVAVLVASAFLAGGLSGSLVESGAQTSTPSPADATNALTVISAFVAAHAEDTTTTTAAPAATTTTEAPPSTTTAAPATTTTAAPATTTTAPPVQGVVALHPGTSWDWQIAASTPLLTSLDNATGAQKMLDVDMENTSAAQLQAITAKDIVPVCYIETGSWESYRSDASQFPAAALGKTLNGYPDERYLDVRNGTVESLIKARIQRAADKGCQGIEPDLDDTWQGNGYTTGFALPYADVLAYNHRLADYAHSLGLAFGLKNAAGTKQVADSVAFTDFALNEQCQQYSECNYGPYVAAGKAVFQVEYKTAATTFCPKDNTANYDGLKLVEDHQNGTNRLACRNG